MFEVGTVIDSVQEIGDMNEFGVRSVVGEGSKVESFCQINAGVSVAKGTKVESYSVVYEDGGKMLKNEEFNIEERRKLMKDLTAYLLEVLPKSNKVS